jgi:hypothetical protein
VSVVASIVARNWEWLLIAGLAFAGWQLSERVQLQKAAIGELAQQVDDARAQLAQEREAVARARRALAARERTLHENRRRAETAQAVIRISPDDGCLDRNMPADVIRVLNAGPSALAASELRPELAAPAPAPTAAGRADLAAPGRLHSATGGERSDGRSGQGGRATPLPGG